MPASKQSRHAEVARRYKRRDKPQRSLIALRIRDLTRLYRARYRHQLPDDDTGREAARIMAHHLSSVPGDPRKRINDWLRLWAPWLSLAEAEEVLAEALLRPQRWTADKLAWRLRLIEADRRTLRITTIGAIDAGKAERATMRRERNRLAGIARRRAKGTKPRAEYLASVRKAKPWAAAGMSRATWFRRKRET